MRPQPFAFRKSICRSLVRRRAIVLADRPITSDINGRHKAGSGLKET
jgi:hypothetical protein